ncbi:MAG: hypothetical protein B6D45_01030, partial [Ignavibacteriales bacterium UTCHB3]
PIFNRYEVKDFGGLKQQDVSILLSGLLINQLQIVFSRGTGSRVILMLHQFDVGVEGADELQHFEGLEVIYYEKGEEANTVKELEEEFVNNGQILAIVNPFVMGLVASDYEFLSNLSDQEDEVIVLNRSENNHISLVVVNNYEANSELLATEITKPWDEYLKTATALNSRPIITSSGMVVSEPGDFRRLYDFLSGKGSISACSFQMHDRFTELFVEYKEIL